MSKIVKCTPLAREKFTKIKLDPLTSNYDINRFMRMKRNQNYLDFFSVIQFVVFVKKKSNNKAKK